MVFFRASPRSAEDPAPDLPPTGPVYRVYKRRFVGLAQLVLLNIIVSWDVCILPSLRALDAKLMVVLQWLTFSSISTTAAEHFGVSESAVNWMSTGYLFAFCVASP